MQLAVLLRCRLCSEGPKLSELKTNSCAGARESSAIRNANVNVDARLVSKQMPSCNQTLSKKGINYSENP